MENCASSFRKKCILEKMKYAEIPYDTWEAHGQMNFNDFPEVFTMKEIWRDVPEYDGKYQLDTEGNVRRVFPSGKTRKMKPYHKKMTGSQRMVVKLTKEGKSKEEILVQIMAKTFLGPIPDGCVPYHKNGCQSDNYIQNIGYISRKELGKLTGSSARRQPVAKIDSNGQIVEVYPSARECAKRNYMSYQTIMDRCNGKCKSAFAPDGYAYAWEDKEVSMKNAIRKIEEENGFMPRAKQIEFEW